MTDTRCTGKNAEIQNDDIRGRRGQMITGPDALYRITETEDEIEANKTGEEDLMISFIVLIIEME